MEDDEFKERVTEDLRNLGSRVDSLFEKVGQLRGGVAAIAALVGSVVSGVIIAVVTAVLAMTVGGCEGGSYPAQEAVLEESVIAIVDDEGYAFCSGVSTPDGVYTAEHCLFTDDIVRVGVYSDQPSMEDGAWTRVYTLDVIRRDADSDAALLEPLPWRLARRVTVSEDQPYVGQPVVAIGHPLGLPYMATHGYVGRLPSHPPPALDRFADPTLWLDIQIDEGMSGGPVFDRDGRVIGLVSWGGFDTLRGAVPASSLLALRTQDRNE